MIPLVLAQLLARWGQALALLVLAAAAGTVVVGAQVYAADVDRAAVAHALETGERRERVVSVGVIERAWRDPPASLGTHADVLARMPALTPVITVEIRVQGLRDEAPPAEVDRMAARDGFCRHVSFPRGRCPVGSREAALPSSRADALDLGPGDVLTLTPVQRTGDGWVPDGPPVVFTLVGAFEPDDHEDPYWQAQDLLGRAGPVPAILTNRTALQGLEHRFERVHADAILPEAALGAEQIPEIRDQLAAAEARVVATGLGTRLDTQVPQLLDRITRNGDQARALLPVTAGPLVALCWLVIYLAVSHGVSARRHEAGVVALRGAGARTRWMVSTAESLIPVLVGVPLGVVVAHLLVAVAGPAGAARPAIDQGQLLAAGLAAAGAVLAALLAVRRELAAPVALLLRRVPPRRGWAVAAAEVLAVALAVVVVVDLRVFDRELVGVMVAAPALVMLAVAVLAARALRPLVDLLGRWSLRRGHPGTAMAGFYLARRPGAGRLVVALGLVLSVPGFAVASTVVAADGRLTQAEQALGATRVLTLEAVERDRLLHAVRAADPTGRHAMAAVVAPADVHDPRRVAVDATRLAAVANWSPRYGDRDAQQVARLLRPPAPEPVRVGDGELVAELTEDSGFTASGSVSVELRLAPQRGGAPVSAVLGPVTTDQRSYRTRVTGCADGCRLLSVGVRNRAHQSPFEVTWFSLRQHGREVLPADLLAEVDLWRRPDRGSDRDHLSIDEAAGGLVLSHRSPRADAFHRAQRVAAPYPLPVVTSGQALPGDLLTNLDGQPVRVAAAARRNALPGLTGAGVLMDLEHALRSELEPGPTHPPQVWLGPDAPAGIVDRLTDEGLIVTGERDLDQLRADLDASGAALALRFFLGTGVVAVLVGLLALALTVTVDRPSWRRSLHQLRVQGLAERTSTRAVRNSYGVMVLAACLVGVPAAGAAWLATRDRLPLGVDHLVLAPWPQWPPVLVSWTVVVAALLGAAGAAARWLRGQVRMEGEG